MKNSTIYRLLFWCTMILLLGLNACENPTETTNASKTYFDLRGFMQQQITTLNKIRPKVKKQVVNNGKTASKEVTIANWEKELRMFTNADLNKAALIGTYDIQNSTSKVGNPLVKYTAKENSNAVQEMTIELDDSKKQAKSIAIRVGSDNLLFSSGTQLKLTCKKTSNNQYQITSYEIKGFQKIVMRDKRPYQIRAEIL